MAKQDDTMPCVHVGCKGTMTYHQKLLVGQGGKQPVQPSNMVGSGPGAHPDYAGWLCDADWRHVTWDKP